VPKRAFFELAGAPPVPPGHERRKQGQDSPPGAEIVIAFGDRIDTPDAWQRRQEMIHLRLPY
jgi:hypothetical protein